MHNATLICACYERKNILFFHKMLTILVDIPHSEDSSQSTTPAKEQTHTFTKFPDTAGSDEEDDKADVWKLIKISKLNIHMYNTWQCMCFPNAELL